MSSRQACVPCPPEPQARDLQAWSRQDYSQHSLALPGSLAPPPGLVVYVLRPRGLQRSQFFQHYLSGLLTRTGRQTTLHLTCRTLSSVRGLSKTVRWSQSKDICPLPKKARPTGPVSRWGNGRRGVKRGTPGLIADDSHRAHRSSRRLLRRCFSPTQYRIQISRRAHSWKLVSHRASFFPRTKCKAPRGAPLCCGVQAGPPTTQLAAWNSQPKSPLPWPAATTQHHVLKTNL